MAPDLGGVGFEREMAAVDETNVGGHETGQRSFDDGDEARTSHPRPGAEWALAP